MLFWRVIYHLQVDSLGRASYTFENEPVFWKSKLIKWTPNFSGAHKNSILYSLDTGLDLPYCSHSQKYSHSARLP